MPLQYLTAFLRVVADEGKGVTEYAEHAGVSKTVMMRHLLDIGERSRDLSEGFTTAGFQCFSVSMGNYGRAMENY